MPQSSDKANPVGDKSAGVGVTTLKVNPDMPTGSAPGNIKPSGVLPSGSSQSDSRGPQGNGK